MSDLAARMQQTLDHAQATGPNPTSQRALEYRLAEAINALASTPAPAESGAVAAAATDLLSLVDDYMVVTSLTADDRWSDAVERLRAARAALQSEKDREGEDVR